MKFKKFLNTALGSYLKVLLPAFGVIWNNYGVKLFDGSKEMCGLILGIVISSAIPILVNALNSEDTRYGKSVKPVSNLAVEEAPLEKP